MNAKDYLVGNKVEETKDAKANAFSGFLFRNFELLYVSMDNSKD